MSARHPAADDDNSPTVSPLINGADSSSESDKSSYTDIDGVGPPAPRNGTTLPPSASTLPSSHGEGEYSSFVAYCVTVNYILGVGVIGMPKAYVTGGWLLSTIVLFIVSIMATFTALWYVEVGHRATRKEKQLLSASTHRGDIEVVGGPLYHSLADHPNSLDSGSSASMSAASSFASNASSISSSLSSIHLSSTPSLMIAGSVVEDAVMLPPTPSKPRRIEVNEMIGLFIGQRTRKVYEVLLCIYMMGSLWSYTSVFSTAMAANVPLPFLNNGDVCVVSDDRGSPCYGLYVFYNFVFACFVVPIACLNLTEMKGFVVALAMLRFVAITAMILTAIEMMYAFPATDTTGNSVSSSSSAPYYSDALAFNWSGLGTIFPICIFAQIFHHSVPGIAYPLADKQQVPKVFSSCLFTMFSLYSSLSITLALYFGSAVLGQCTLNWKNYTGNAASLGSDRSGMAAFISYLIVLFPPADVVSAFPLKAITVGNNIMHSFLSPAQAMVRRKQIPFRLFAAISPIVGACIFNDLTVLLTYTGSLGVVIAFLFPTWLQYKSKKEFGGGSVVLRGKVEQVVNSQYAIYGVLIFCVAGLITVVVQIFQGAAGH